MSLERVLRIAQRLRQPVVYDGPEFDEPMVVMPLSHWEAVTDPEVPVERVSSAQGQLPLGGERAAVRSVVESRAEEPRIERVEPEVPQNVNRRLLEVISQFSDQAGRPEVETVFSRSELQSLPLRSEVIEPMLERVMEPVSVMAPSDLVPVMVPIEAGSVEEVMLEERFYFEG